MLQDVKGETLKLAKSAGGPYIPPRKAGKRELEGIWGQETEWNTNKNPELGTQKVELRIQNKGLNCRMEYRMGKIEQR